MPKQTKINLADAAQRAKLASRSSAYMHRLRKGVFVGLYVGPRERTWRARIEGQPDRSIGDEASMSFVEAAAEVERLAGGGVVEQRRTIGEAWAAYEGRAERTKTRAAVRVIRGYGKLIEPLFDRVIADTPLPAFNDWRDRLLTFDGSRPRGPKTVNKAVRSLKAALNADGTEGPWQKLRQLDEPDDEEEPHVLTPDQMRATVAAACTAEPAFARLWEGLWLTGCRPGELREAKPQDYRPGVLTIRISKTGKRHLTLTPTVDRFMAAQAARGGAYLFETADGQQWGEHDLRRPLERVLKSMGEDAVDAVPYTARHSYITAGIYAGVPPFVLAKHTGTSIAMIERTYGHVIAEMQADTLARMDAVLAAPVALEAAE